MKKVIVFGDLPIATKIVMFLESLEEVEVGVVIGNEKPHVNDPWKDIPILTDYADKKSIKKYTMSQISELFKDGELTLGLSCRFSKIIKENVIKKFRYGLINMHGGILPEFAGLCSANQMILQGSSIGGGTLHYIDAGIDTGKIIKICDFPILSNDTAFSVFQKTQFALEQELENIIPNALNGFVKCIDQDVFFKEGHKSNYYNKKSLEDLRQIKLKELNEDEIMLRIRGFDFPGYEPAYIIDKNGNKIYLRYHY